MKVEDDQLIGVSNEEVVNKMVSIQKDPDTDYGYHKMTYALMLLGFVINHKKVYRLMKSQYLLKDRHPKASRTFVKYRKVLPSGPLEVLEMDIKFAWVEEYKRHAFILTVIDTFTRVALYWATAYQIKQAQVKIAWEQIIEHYLQPLDCLNRNIVIEIRNDNDSRFAANSIQKFFKENHLNQVFTHPYTPQENGHIESFHAILSRALNKRCFWSMPQLDEFLEIFYDKYNNHRLHSATAYLPPNRFWACWDQDLINVQTDQKARKIKFKLKIPYHQLSGNMNLMEVPCYQMKTLDGFEFDLNKKMIGAETFQQPSV